MKFESLLSKTGLDKRDLSLIKFSIPAVVAMLASFFSSCSNTGFKGSSTGSVVSTSTYSSEGSQIEPKDIEKIVDTPEDFKKRNCGPTPGYPCGTKYYTISISDFGIV